MIGSNILFEFILEKADLIDSALAGEAELETYCKCVYGAQSVKSVPRLGKIPIWNECFKFHTALTEKNVKLSIINNKKPEKTAEIGSVIIEIEKFFPKEEQTIAMQIQNGDQVIGNLYIKLTTSQPIVSVQESATNKKFESSVEKKNLFCGEKGNLKEQLKSLSIGESLKTTSESYLSEFKGTCYKKLSPAEVLEKIEAIKENAIKKITVHVSKPIHSKINTNLPSKKKVVVVDDSKTKKEYERKKKEILNNMPSKSQKCTCCNKSQYIEFEYFWAFCAGDHTGEGRFICSDPECGIYETYSF